MGLCTKLMEIAHILMQTFPKIYRYQVWPHSQGYSRPLEPVKRVQIVFGGYLQETHGKIIVE